MMLFFTLLNLIYLLLPALVFARATPPKSPVSLASHDIKRLSTPWKNSLRKRDAITLPGTSDVPTGLALNSTDEQYRETLGFEEAIDIPGLGSSIQFLVKGTIDADDASVTVELWLHATYDRRIGVYQGSLVQGVDMKPPASKPFLMGEEALFMVARQGWAVLVFEAKAGSVNVQQGSSKTFPAFTKAIKRWKLGPSPSLEDVPNNPGVHTPSDNSGVDTSVSVE